MGLSIDDLLWLRILMAFLLLMIVYIVNKKIPSGKIQRKEGERIISKRLFKDGDEVRAEFHSYFNRILVFLILISSAFLVVNVLMTLAVDIFLASQGLEFMFFGDLPLPQLSRMTVSIVGAFMLCSGGWLMIVVLFWHNRSLQLALRFKYYDLFQESQEQLAVHK